MSQADPATTMTDAAMPASADFNPEQKRYLEGFVAGMQIARTARGLSSPAAGEIAGAVAAAPPAPAGPDAASRSAQDRVLAAGGKLAGRVTGKDANDSSYSWEVDFDLTLPAKGAAAGPGCGS